MNKLHSTIAFALLWLMACVASAQQVMIVSVTANGYGRTESQALSDAVINGVAQVNGETVAASMRVTTTSTASTWAEVTPRARQWGPPLLLATLPPIVQACWLEGSGANCRPCAM